MRKPQMKPENFRKNEKKFLARKNPPEKHVAKGEKKIQKSRGK